MPVRYLSDPELARLSSWPDEIAVEDVVTYFTLSADDLSWLAGFNRQHNRLGVAVQLSTLPWLGWIPDDLAGCPPIALDRLAQALGIAPDSSLTLLAEYGGWQGRTRREHRARVLARLGWRFCAAAERKLLDEFLVARALEHDAPGVLLQLACDWLRAERIVRPPVDSLTRRVATARDAARAETYHRLGPLLQPPRPMQLDGLLDVDPDLGLTRLAWLRRGATVATPELLKAELDKLEFLRRHGADQLDLSRLPVGRRRMLAEIGRRSTNQALQRAAVDRRHPVLLRLIDVPTPDEATPREIGAPATASVLPIVAVNQGKYGTNLTNQIPHNGAGSAVLRFLDGGGGSGGESRWAGPLYAWPIGWAGERAGAADGEAAVDPQRGRLAATVGGVCR
jgi:hypothetical protein